MESHPLRHHEIGSGAFSALAATFGTHAGFCALSSETPAIVNTSLRD